MTPQKRTALRAKLQRKLESLAQAKAEAARASADAKVLQDEALGLMDEIGLKSFSYDDGEGHTVKGTRVQATRLEFDQPQLKKAVGAAQWNKITVRVLDTGLLEDAIAEGRIDPVKVAACSDEIKNKPYVKLSSKKSKNGGSETSQIPSPQGQKRGRRRMGTQA